MSPTVYMWAFRGTIVLAIAGAIFAFGYRTAENKLQPEINRLNAALLVFDLKAKEDEIKSKEIANVIKNKDTEYRAAIERYKRMLHSKDNFGSSQTPSNPEGVGTGLTGQTLSGCPPEAELKFLNDVRVREGMKDFFIRHNYPVVE